MVDKLDVLSQGMDINLVELRTYRSLFKPPLHKSIIENAHTN